MQRHLLVLLLSDTLLQNRNKKLKVMSDLAFFKLSRDVSDLFTYFTEDRILKIYLQYENV